jgi:hypothetical protein
MDSKHLLSASILSIGLILVYDILVWILSAAYGVQLGILTYANIFVSSVLLSVTWASLLLLTVTILPSRASAALRFVLIVVVFLRVYELAYVGRSVLGTQIDYLSVAYAISALLAILSLARYGAYKKTLVERLVTGQ